ncbi:MAG TPA: DUF4856 domain-containing protein [Salinimicrobium sp.]|nr:DUF4856 domain-containing protein [Salinimicrobium sp.]
MKKFLLSAAILGSFTFVSCSSDDSSGTQPQVEVPANYTFTRNGETTVSYDGQTTRLGMVKEMTSAFMDFDNTTQESLSNMFSNTNSPFANADFNTSGKSVKSKVAASNDYFSINTVESTEIKEDFESFINTQTNEVFTNQNEVAAPGVAGQIPNGDNVRYVDSKGFEMNQVFAKGLMGALLMDQILNNYLSPQVLDAGENVANNDAEIVEEGKNYTTMEHKWDEAYGYLYGDPSVPTANPNSVLNASEDRMLFNYLGRVDSDSDFAGLANNVFEAFKTGRAAIVAGDYDLRNEQIAIIKENLSKILAVRAVHYFQAGKTEIENGNRTNAFHALSEGFGFLYGIRFTNNPAIDAPYVSKSQIDIVKDQLLAGNGFWDVTPETLQTISEGIATSFGFTVEAAAE